MVMEFLAGEPLSTRVLKLGRIPIEVMAPLLLQLLEGLDAAHSAGIIHRDLKPDNVFLQRTKQGGDFVKIVDFGVSKFNALSGGAAMSMTRTGAMVGTPYYMSPEQVRGAKLVDHRSDLYSVGVVLFECITGSLPFQAETFNELMFKIALEPPADAERLVPGLDPRFAAIVRKAMAREPAHRYDSAQHFAAAVAEWMQAAGVAMPAGHASISQSGAGAQSPFANSSGGHPVVLATTPNPGGPLDKTTASGSMSKTPSQPQPKKGNAAIAAVAIGVVVLAAAGIGVMQMSKGKPAVASPASETATAPAAVAVPTATVAASAPPTAIAPPPAATVVASAAPTINAAPGPSETASSAHVAVVHPMIGAGHPVAPVAAPPPAASANSMTLKGRTIRTEL
jgi:serine/threonine-protein kinase